MNDEILVALVEVLNGCARTSWTLWRAEFAAQSDAIVTTTKGFSAWIVARLAIARFAARMVACQVGALPCTRFLFI